MLKYHLTISLKTKVLNFFRRFFMLPLFDKLLLFASLNSSSSIIKKMVPPNYLYPKGSKKRVSRNGINYILDISNVVDHTIYFNLEKPFSHSLLPQIKEAKVILDIGGNIGNSALYYASINPTAKILSFEPHPEIFKKELENISINTFQNIEVINLGLGVQRASFKLYEVEEHNPGMNRILLEETKFPFKMIEVDVLDDILKNKCIDKVDFIKIDVEGFEYSVLLGAKKTLQTKPLLFIELNDSYLKENKSSAKEVVELLIDIGYDSFLNAENGNIITASTSFHNCHFDLIAR